MDFGRWREKPPPPLTQAQERKKTLARKHVKHTRCTGRWTIRHVSTRHAELVPQPTWHVITGRDQLPEIPSQPSEASETTL
ncbi:uncharacterized protein G2W53_042325 [Senna tora]|uniref:Uncharacterized protein n=1 Tax=Senna tora TaxID=362788 RepID=A0A834SGK0_9FABA|nr:uncharacterized protein G2W53_042325 [Senna tora]